MTSGSPARMTELALRAIYHSGRRGILLSGWAGLSPSLLSFNVPDVSHRWHSNRHALATHRAERRTRNTAAVRDRP